MPDSGRRCRQGPYVPSIVGRLGARACFRISAVFVESNSVAVDRPLRIYGDVSGYRRGGNKACAAAIGCGVPAGKGVACFTKRCRQGPYVPSVVGRLAARTCVRIPAVFVEGHRVAVERPLGVQRHICCAHGEGTGYSAYGVIRAAAIDRGVPARKRVARLHQIACIA